MNNKILTIIKKIISSSLMFLMVVSSFSFAPIAQANVVETLTIGSQSAVYNDVITVPITASITNIQGIQFSINYPESILEYVGCSSTNVVCSTDVASSTNKVNLTWYDVTNFLTLDDANLLSLQFRVLSSDVSNTVLSFTPAVIVNNVDVDITGDITFNSGTLTLNSVAPDTTAPVITLLGSTPVVLSVGDSYTDAGATASDDVDGDLTTSIIQAGTFIDTSIAGIYTITYNVSDTANNPATEVTRTVNVVAPLSSDKDIVSFSFIDLGSGVILGTDITVGVPFGTNVTALTPTIDITGATVSPISGVAQNFTDPIEYTVTATNSSTQIYTVTVTFGIDPDIALLAADKDALVDDSIKGGNSDLSNITVALTSPLPSSGSNDSTITWASSNTAVISNDGQTINRPTFVDGNITVTLTATLTKGAVTDTKVFSLTVLKLPASTIATITSTTYTIGADTITDVPFGTAKTTFLTNLIKGETYQTWVDTNISDPVVTENTLVVTAQDGVTTIAYTVTVDAEPDTTPPTISLFYPDDNATNVSVNVQPTLTFSEAMDTSTINGENIELREYATYSADATKVPAALTYSEGNIVTFILSSSLEYSKQYYFFVGTGVKDISGNSFDAGTWYHAQRANHEFITEAAPLSSIAITHSADKLSYTVGDILDTTGLEVTGTYGDGSTQVETITVDNITGFDSSAPAIGQVLTITIGEKTTTYTVNIDAPLSSVKEITSFSFTEGSGTINESAHTIAVTVPYGTDVIALVPTIAVSAGASVSPNSGVAQDFTSPVTYTVTAENSSTQDYVVTVNFSENPDIAFLAADKDALVDDSIKGENFDLSNITGALTNPLPPTGSNGSTITWVSSNPDIVSNNGQTVVRPAFVASDVIITLTATLTKGGLTDTKIFTLVVLKLPVSVVATVTSGSYTVSIGGTTAETITNVPFGVSKTIFLSALAKGESNQVWDDTGITDPVVTDNTLVVTAQDGITQVTYTITTSDNPDIALVAFDRDALVDDSIKGANADLENITEALATLPAVGSVNSSEITWASSNTAVISNDGQTINRPVFADGNITVTLTATLTKGVITQTKAFTLIVLKLPASTITTVTSGTYTVNDGASIITGVPYATASSTFLSAITKGESHQTWDSSNLTNPVITGNTLFVTAQDGSTTRTYTLTVDLNPTKAITAFSFPEGIGVINETNHTISVNVPFGTDVSALTSTISITSGTTINVYDAVQDFTSPITYTVTAADSSTQDYTVTVTILEATQIAPDGSGDVTVSTTTPQVVITHPTQAVNVAIGSGITNPTIDVSSFILGGTGMLPEINITSANANNATVAIPASTVVTSADNTWNGIIAAPTATTVTIPETSGQTKTFSTAIEIGFTGAKLSFDKAVRILLVGQAGKKTGYVRTGTTFTEITAVCSADTQVAGNALAVDGECKIDVGADLVIWTKHFTKFATYTQTTDLYCGDGTCNGDETCSSCSSDCGSCGGGGGGGGGGSYALAAVTYAMGDINGSGKVDEYDFALMMSAWGKTGTGLAADFNSDNKVDEYDFSLLMVNWSIS